MHFDDILLGTQYYRAPTPLKDEWNDDLDNVKQIGLNIIQIRLSWRWYEIRENEYDLSLIDELILKAKEKGFKIIIKFMLETAPSYIFNKYNGTRVKHDGSLIRQGAHAAFYGGFKPCFTNPKVLERAKLFVEYVAKRYQNEESIILYNIWNEIRNKTFDECFCPSCQKAYQNYLKNKFGTIEKYNEYYGVADPSFDEIELPSTPHAYYDLFEFKKFKGSYELNRYLKEIYQSVRKYNKATPIMAHTGIACCFQSTVEDICDDYNASKSVDFFGTSVGCSSNMEDYESRLNYLLLNSYLKSIDKDYFVHEIYPGLGRFRDYDTPFSLSYKLYSSLAYGSKGLVFWQYKAERIGNESDCAGLVNMDGSDKGISSVVKSFSGDLYKDMNYFVHMEERNDLAIMFDFDSNLINEIEDICGEDFEFRPFEVIKYYHLAHSHLFKSLLKLGYTPDYVQSRDIDSFKNYKAIFIPSACMLTNKTIKALEEYVNNGGIILADESFLMREENTWMRLKVPFNGMESKIKTRNLVYKKEITINNSKVIVGPYYSIYESNNGEALLKDDNNEPIITKFNIGKGKLYLFGFSLGYSAMLNIDLSMLKLLMDKVIPNIKTYDYDLSKLFIKELYGKDYKVIFLFNLDEQAAQYRFDSELISKSNNVTVKDNVVDIPNKTCGYIILKLK